MNHIYRIVWNAALGVWQAVGEIGKGRKKGKSEARKHRSHKAALALALFISGGQLYAAVLPEGAQVTAGSATINTSGNTMNIVQGTDKAAINWQSFNIGANNTVNVQQNNASSVLLNRVVGNEASLIQGMLNANGQVYILNANGIMITQGAQINVAGLVASTLNISDADFMAGKTTFEANGTKGSIINLGTITTQDGGYVALLGNQVKNEGIITAQLGTAIMAAGDKVSLNFNGNSLVNATIDQGTLNALVENKNAIIADGGLVILTAKGLDEVMRTVVNNTGEVRAQTIEEKNGKIYLLGGMENDRIEVDGKLDASAPTTGDGGFIETSAANVVLKETKQVTTKASNGKTGKFLIDPNDYTIAATGGNITGAQLGTDLASNNVQISTATQGTSGGNGDIHVNDNVTWTSGNTLTLTAERNINVNANIDASGGSGGKVVLEYGQGAVAAGNTADYNIVRNVSINLADGQNFSTKLGSDTVVNYTVINSAAALQAINTDTTTLSGNFALGSDVDLSGVTWTPIGISAIYQNYSLFPNQSGTLITSDGFTGSFAGLGHQVNNLTIQNAGVTGTYVIGENLNISNLNGISEIGLFGSIVGGDVRDLSLKNASIDTNPNGALGVQIGVLATFANSDSIIKNIHVLDSTINVADGTSVTNVGGIIGFLRNGSEVINSSAIIDISGNAERVGGLVGAMMHDDGNYEQPSIKTSYASGSIEGLSSVGGIVGAVRSGGLIQNSYSIADVSGETSVGGIVGDYYSANGDYASANLTLQNVFASGVVSATGINTNFKGGLIGSIGESVGSLSPNAATITNAYWDTTTTGQQYAIGGGTSTTGLIANANAYTQASYTNFDFTNDWFMVDGYTRPFLRMEWTPVISNAHQLQLMSMNLGNNYKLANDINLAPSLTNKSEMWKDNSPSLDFSDYKGSFSPISTFTGAFDGSGHIIDSLRIDRVDINADSAGRFVGFFGKVGSGANIKDVG